MCSKQNVEFVIYSKDMNWFNFSWLFLEHQTKYSSGLCTHSPEIYSYHMLYFSYRCHLFFCHFILYWFAVRYWSPSFGMQIKFIAVLGVKEHERRCVY